LHSIATELFFVFFRGKKNKYNETSYLFSFTKEDCIEIGFCEDIFLRFPRMALVVWGNFFGVVLQIRNRPFIELSSETKIGLLFVSLLASALHRPSSATP